jgi:hypothetical protein
VLSVTDGPGEASKQSGEKTGLPTVPGMFLVLSNITYTVKKRLSVHSFISDQLNKKI